MFNIVRLTILEPVRLHVTNAIRRHRSSHNIFTQIQQKFVCLSFFQCLFDFVCNYFRSTTGPALVYLTANKIKKVLKFFTVDLLQAQNALSNTNGFDKLKFYEQISAVLYDFVRLSLIKNQMPSSTRLNSVY